MFYQEQRVIVIDQRGTFFYGLAMLGFYIILALGFILTFFTVLPLCALIYTTRKSLSRFWLVSDRILGLLIPLTLASGFLHLALYEHYRFSTFQRGEQWLSIWVTLFLLAGLMTVFAMTRYRGWSRRATAGALLVALATYVVLAGFTNSSAIRPLFIVLASPSIFAEWSISFGSTALAHFVDFIAKAFTGSNLDLSSTMAEISMGFSSLSRSAFQSHFIGWWVYGIGYLLACWLFGVLRWWTQKVVY